MKITSVAEMKSQLSSYVREAEQGPVVVTRNGKPVAVLLGVTDEDELDRLVLAYSPKFRGILDAARQRIRGGKGIPHEDFWEEVESPPNRKERSRKRPKSA
jgi:prevent-host-death family protein